MRIENDVIGEIGVLDLPLQRNYMHCFCELEGALGVVFTESAEHCIAIQMEEKHGAYISS